MATRSKKTEEARESKITASEILASREVLEYRLVGVTAILMNNGAALVNAANRSEGKSVTTRRIPLPAEEAEAGVYRTEGGQLYMPGEAARKAMVEAGRGKKFSTTRRGANTVIRGSVFLLEDVMLLENPETGEPIKDYVIDSRRAVPPGQGAVTRSRPSVKPPWSCILRLEAFPRAVGVETLLPTVDELLAIAGTVVGIGNFRPEKGGSFGRFRVERL